MAALEATAGTEVSDGFVQLTSRSVKDWKVSFLEQNHSFSPELPQGPWMGQFTKLRVPKLYKLRADPFERGPESGNYFDWFNHRVFMLVPAQEIVAKLLETFKEFPPRAKAASFTVSDAMEAIEQASPQQN